MRTWYGSQINDTTLAELVADCRPPMTYALHWRMPVAYDALRFSGRSLDEIALAAGYGSATAFSTAFTRTVGRPPARFARDSGGVRSEGY
jgi:transcriptional regulator GlxA family with amidase domain